MTVFTSTGRQLPRRPSPLANHWVAAGFAYDVRTGLVSPVTPTSSGNNP
jgi:demethoxyubiquinone hydroxylase (CLK1/Coq7/Cat5 family)